MDRRAPSPFFLKWSLRGKGSLPRWCPKASKIARTGTGFAVDDDDDDVAAAAAAAAADDIWEEQIAHASSPLSTLPHGKADHAVV